MTYLQLGQRACVECGVASGSAIALALPTTAGATGSIGRVVNWVGDAWNDVQTMFDDWTWMRSSNVLGAGASFSTIAGQATYPLGPVSTGRPPPPAKVGVAVDAFGKWDRSTFRCYPTATGVSGEQYLDDVDFETWRDVYMFGANRSVQTRSQVIAVGPDQSLNLGPPPNGLYTITADYFVAPSVMALDTDVPTGLPTRFHMLLVYLAMVKAAGYESAPELMQRGSTEASRMMAQLMAARAPSIGFAGALA